jgi:hypothetical protein
MAYCERLSEQLGVVATIDPVVVTGTVAVSDIFSMAMHRRALFILQTEAAFAQAVVLIQENVAQAFTAATATLLTGAATTVTANASQYLYEVSAEAMTAGFTWLRASLTGITPNDIISMVVLADVERYHPASDRDLNTVTIQATA